MANMYRLLLTLVLVLNSAGCAGLVNLPRIRSAPVAATETHRGSLTRQDHSMSDPMHNPPEFRHKASIDFTTPPAPIVSASSLSLEDKSAQSTSRRQRDLNFARAQKEYANSQQDKPANAIRPTRHALVVGGPNIESGSDQPQRTTKLASFYVIPHDPSPQTSVPLSVSEVSKPTVSGWTPRLPVGKLVLVSLVGMGISWRFRRNPSVACLTDCSFDSSPVRVTTQPFARLCGPDCKRPESSDFDKQLLSPKICIAMLDSPALK